MPNRPFNKSAKFVISGLNFHTEAIRFGKNAGLNLSRYNQHSSSLNLRVVIHHPQMAIFDSLLCHVYIPFLGSSTGEFQALQLIVLAAFEAVD